MAEAKIYYQSDCNLSLLDGKTIAIIGYGSQGHAHALNLKDSGCHVIIGLYEGSKSWKRAEEQGFEVFTAAEAAKRADIIMILINDEKQAKLYKDDIEPNLEPGNMLMFAHGFNIHFGLIKAPKGVDVTMIAPKAPGHTVRSEYQAGKGTPCLVAVEQDETGKALDMALAYGLGIGTCVADFTAYQTEHPFDGSAVTLEYEHSGKTKEITVTPVENTYANVQFSYQLREKQSPIGVLKYSVLEIKYWVRTVIDSVSMLITGQYSVNDLSGPVGVVDAIGTAYDDVKSQGVLVTVMTMLNMVILLSSNLGVMNLLPLPALDGGRLVFLIIEAIRRKPIRRDLEGMVHFAGLVLLMALMVYVMIHDVQRIL